MPGSKASKAGEPTTVQPRKREFKSSKPSQTHKWSSPFLSTVTCPHNFGGSIFPLFKGRRKWTPKIDKFSDGFEVKTDIIPLVRQSFYYSLWMIPSANFVLECLWNTAKLKNLSIDSDRVSRIQKYYWNIPLERAVLKTRSLREL